MRYKSYVVKQKINTMRISARKLKSISIIGLEIVFPDAERPPRCRASCSFSVSLLISACFSLSLSHSSTAASLSYPSLSYLSLSLRWAHGADLVMLCFLCRYPSSLSTLINNCCYTLCESLSLYVSFSLSLSLLRVLTRFVISDSTRFDLFTVRFKHHWIVSTHVYWRTGWGFSGIENGRKIQTVLIKRYSK